MGTMLKIVCFIGLVSGCLASVPFPGPTPGNEFLLPGPPYQPLQFGPNLYQPDFMKLPLGFPGHVHPFVYFEEPHGPNFPLNLQHFEPRPFGHRFPHPLPMNVPLDNFGLDVRPLGFPSLQGQRFPPNLTPQVGNEVGYYPQLDNARRLVRMPREFPEESHLLNQNKSSNKIVFLNSKGSGLNSQKHNLTTSQPQLRDRTNQNSITDDRQPREISQLVHTNDDSDQ